MTPIPSKRHRNNGVQKPRKRQRRDTLVESGIKTKAIALDSLPWQEVALPDRLEDAEGFFGLEEIEDVDIVRDTQTGQIEFKVNAGAVPTESWDPPDHAPSNINELIENEGSWTGFDESDSNDGDTTLTLNAGRKPSDQAAGPEDKMFKKTKRRSSDNIDAEKAQGLRHGEFSSLPKESEEDIDVSSWASLDLAPQIMSAISRLRFAKPTPIQSAAIPQILSGHDVIGKASTGSGKTLAFGIPIFEQYLEDDIKRSGTAKNEQTIPVALILSPTRELAHQLSAHLTDLCSNVNSNNPRIATLTGGLSIHKQQRLLATADIVIGTPGRLWEVIDGSTGLIESLKQIRYLVVDEADRLLSEGHFKEVEEILNALDREGEGEGEGDVGGKPCLKVSKAQRQTLVFSATFQKDLQQKLAGKGKPFGGNLMSEQESMEYLLKKLNFREEKPKFIDVDPVHQMARGLKEGLIECANLEKDLYLYALILQHTDTRTLIFTNSITSVRRLTSLLQTLNVPALALHSQMPQKARLRSVERFSSPLTPSSILVATDVAARGLDISSVQLVLHYHVPRAADMYVHRSGRTARAEKSGISILLCAPEEVQGVRRLVAKVHSRNSSTNSKNNFMQAIELDRRVVARLKPRVTLAKKISDAALAKEKQGHEDNWLKTAAEDLGVDYDSEEFAENAGTTKGRGAGRNKAEKEARGLTKAEVGALRAELKEMLSKRVNVGVSERYLTAGGMDIDNLLEGKKGEFLGSAKVGLEML